MKLSEREDQMLHMAAKGLTDQGIAHELGISVGTVGTYWGRVRGKMGPHSRSELVARYIQSAASERINQLRRENEQLAAQLEATSVEKQSFEMLIQHAPEGVLFVDRDGNLIAGNQAAADLLGCAVEQFPSLRVGTFIPPELHEKHRGHRETFFANPGKTKMGDHRGIVVTKLDGTPIRIEATVSQATTHLGIVAIVFLRSSPYPIQADQIDS
jgi:PAS domain S-box-containing protein